MYKKHSLILLPVNTKSNIWLRNGKLEYNCSPSSKINPHDLYILNDDEIKEGDWVIDIENNILFKVKEQGHSGLLRSETDSFIKDACRKVIATNTSLKGKWLQTCFSGEEIYEKLPQIPFLFIQYYIEQYNLGNVITEVEVEYEEKYLYPDGNLSKISRLAPNAKPVEILFINEDNTINIKPLKNSWTREEVTKLCTDALNYGYNGLPKYLTPFEGMNKWIENNL